jgi:hypothetical protein
MRQTSRIAAGQPSRVCLVFLVAWVLAHQVAGAQTLTGTLSGTVKDEQGGVLSGAVVRVTSRELIGGERQTTTSDRGQWRLPVLPPGSYTLTVELLPRFKTHREEGISIGVGATIDRPVVLPLAGVAQSVLVEASPGDARDSGLSTRFGSDYLAAIPSRRYSMFDSLKSAPGVSPTSPASGTVNTVSVFGSAVNENMFLIDGTNFTCPCQGVSRAEPSVDVIKEVQVQSTGASVEYGNVQGAVFNVVTKQGSARFEYDASYYAQPSALTAQSVVVTPTNGTPSGYERVRYRDFTTNLGGPVRADRLWFFAGYQYLRDYDSQPGADPAFPRKYEQNKVFGKLTWRLTPSLQMMQSFHQEIWVNPTVPTRAVPFIATQRVHSRVPSMTFANITHVLSNNTVWEARVGRFLAYQDSDPSSGDYETPGHRDTVTGVSSVNSSMIGTVKFDRITGKAVLNRYQQRWLGADHHFRVGTQIERGEHRATHAFPGGVQYVDNNSAKFQAVSREPWILGGRFITAAVFASDSVALTDRITAEAGIRFDHSRAISQDLEGVDATGRPVDGFTGGLGSLYTWNVFSPRLGMTVKLDGSGRTVLRANYGRFNQGVLTGELDPIHPGVSTITTMAYNSATGGYTTFVSSVDPNRNLDLDRHTRTPHTDEYSLAVDRTITSQLTASVAYIRKTGSDFIGWTDTGGRYTEKTHPLPDGTTLQVFEVANTADRLFFLTNPDGPDKLFLKYDGFVVAMEKRLSKGWQASGSYTFSRAYGRQVASNAPAAEAQFSTIARPTSLTFGQDPNDLTNSAGRLPNDRPHVFRTNGVVHLPWQGIVVAANLQLFSGRPWAATAQVPLRQSGQQRIMIETRGSRRLSSQSLLDLRISKTLRLRSAGTIDLRLDVLNLLNDSAEEALQSDVLFNSAGQQNAAFGRHSVFMDPRRVMLSVRLNLGG